MSDSWSDSWSGSSRDRVLGRIGRALADVPATTEPRAADRFRSASDADRASLVDRFAQRAADYKVRVARADRATASAEVARILSGRGVVRLAVPPGLPAEFLPEGFEVLLDDGLEPETIAGCDGVLTTCACAIAETGTLVLDHGAGQGRRILTLLPDIHLCVVPAAVILGLVPEAVAFTEAAVKAGRPLTFISGPSATSDIELSRVEGVHGPRNLDVLIVWD
jgi:L-lactate dehydrogenase complex protein LldG